MRNSWFHSHGNSYIRTIKKLYLLGLLYYIYRNVVKRSMSKLILIFVIHLYEKVELTLKNFHKNLKKRAATNSRNSWWICINTVEEFQKSTNLHCKTCVRSNSREKNCWVWVLLVRRSRLNSHYSFFQNENVYRALMCRVISKRVVELYYEKRTKWFGKLDTFPLRYW